MQQSIELSGNKCFADGTFVAVELNTIIQLEIAGNENHLLRLLACPDSPSDLTFQRLIPKVVNN